MKYVVHRRFKDKAICGEVNLPAMTMCEEANGYIFHGDKLLCVVTSENAHQFFARDDDGAGMLRGKLTQAIQKDARKARCELSKSMGQGLGRPNLPAV